MSKWKEAWDVFRPILATCIVMFAVFCGMLWLKPAEDPAVYSEKRLQHVESSFIEAVGYVWYDKVLIVKFKGNENIYAYYDVPRSEYKQMVGAESIGKYYNENIKGKYDSESESMYM